MSTTEELIESLKWFMKHKTGDILGDEGWAKLNNFKDHIVPEIIQKLEEKK